MTPDVLEVAQYHRRHGRSIIPIASDGTKRPALKTWKPYQTNRATSQELGDWFTSQGHQAMAIVTGAISGGLEMLEIEGQFWHRYHELDDAAHMAGLAELWDRVKGGWVERSPSGGIHWIYQVTDGDVPGNTKIAQDIHPDNPHHADKTTAPRSAYTTFLETRGEGGYFVIAPSSGNAHETGRPWEILNHPEHVVTLTLDERDALIDTFRGLDELPRRREAQSVLPVTPHDPTDGKTPGDDFENRVTWDEILGPHGWTRLGNDGRSTFWRRPGKKLGRSASTGHAEDRDRLYVWSSSTPFETETPYTKLGAYAELNTGGDYSEAARQLRRAGYGQEPAARIGLDSILGTPSTSKDTPCTTPTSPTSGPASTSPNSTTNPTSTTTDGRPDPASPSTTSPTPGTSNAPSTPSAPTSSATATPRSSSTSTSSATTPSIGGLGSGSIFSATYTPSQHENTTPGTTPASSDPGAEQSSPSPQPGQPWPTPSPQPSTPPAPSSTSSAPNSNANANAKPNTPAGPTTADLPAPGDLRPLALSDYGNALALIEHHGTRLRYCSDRGRWLAWNGHVWEWQAKNGGTARQCVLDLASRMAEDTQSMTTWKKRSLSAAGVKATLEQAETDPRIAIRFADLDAHAWELNTPGGTIDLTTGQLLPANPDHLHTRTTPVTPDPTADTTRWEAFLADTFPDGKEMIRYLQRLFGCAVIGEVKEHILPFAYGAGANGKSVLFETIAAVLGEYVTTTAPGFLMASRNEKHPTEIAKLSGVRIAFGAEVNEDDRFNEAKVKMLTGGDSLTGRFMRQDEFRFTPTHTLFLAGNHQPEVESGGESFWRRLRLIPFAHTVPVGSRVPDLQRILSVDHGPAVLAWIAQGAADYCRDGLAEPEGVRAATSDYREAMDTVGRFLEETCEVYPGVREITTSAEVFRKSYEAWCHAEGEVAVRGRALAARLKAHGVLAGKDAPRAAGQRLYAGVRLLKRETEWGICDNQGQVAALVSA